MEANSLAAIASAAETLGISGLRPAPDHALVAFGPEEACQALLAVADMNDFVTRGEDRLIGVSACPGAPSCRSAHIRTHSIGRYAAGQNAELLDGSVRLHLSGCLKGCAHPTAATLAFAGTENATHLVFEGKTTDTPLKRLALRTEAEALTALSALMRLERRPGETSRDCLRRLGPDRIAAALA
jgi:precorrin-3B synthase